MKRLTTRGYAVAEAIRDREDFTTHGALRGGWAKGWEGTGYLNIEEAAEFARAAAAKPIYVVWSYGTPIGWWTDMYGWHRVEQRFSVTTSKHQGKMYLIDHEGD